MLVADAARFQVTDEAPLVAAAFCCPYCLRSASSVKLEILEDGTADAACRCETCDARWEVALSAMQTLRMSLCPPAGVRLT